MNNDNPKVTVRMPAYNHAEYIEEAVLSIVNQTYQDFELIVIDDGSSDDTPLILERLSEDYDFIFLRQENQGVSRTLNTLLDMAKGEYITGCASDDYWPLDRLEKQIHYMEEHPKCQVCYGRVYAVSEGGVEEGARSPYQGTKIFGELLCGCFIPAPSCMVRAEVYELVGSYDSSSYIEDWDMWLRIAYDHEIGYLDDFLVYYRQHGTNMSSNFEKMEQAKLKIIEKWSHTEAYPEAITRWRLSYYCGLLRAKRLRDAAVMLRHIRSFIFRKLFWRANARFLLYLFKK